VKSLVKKGCTFGTHRSLEPKGGLPQPAWKVDNTPVIWENEILIDVETLNIDAASFRQIAEEAKGDKEQIARTIMDTVSQRGKQHNPVTGSGGMLIGRVAEVGKALADRAGLIPGRRLATLVSLSLTPLIIEGVISIKAETCQVDIRGKAVLFESGIYAFLPDDMPEKLALAVLDVAGAPAQTARLVGAGQRVLIIGAGGKSGLLCLHEARKRAGVTGQVIALEYSQAAVERVESLGLADHVIKGDATDAIAVLEAVNQVTGGKLVDITINCVDVPGTEMASILSTRDGGIVYFFSMATSFTKAALGAEGVGKDLTMLIGNGYAPGHAEISLHCLKENPALGELFARLFG
jgi:L-erythro-3,5-diaminohexanoate dehydrogenase